MCIMKKQTIKVTEEHKVSDPNAKAMWGRVKSQTFKDKTIYTRKVKHKKIY
jgi:hypothetical protein